MRVSAVVAACVFSLAGLQAAGVQQPDAAPLRVLSSNGIRAAMERLLSDAERAIGRRVDIRFSSSAELKQSIDQGETFDVAILTPELVDALTRNGTVGDGTKTDLASIDLAVGIRAGAPMADISTPEAIRQRLLAARSLTWTESGAASAANFAMLDALGIRDALAGRIVLQRVGGAAAAEAVARGEHELVLLPRSEIQSVPGLAVLGVLPPLFQRPVVMTAAIAARTPVKDAAAAFIGFLTSAPARRTLETAGMKPAR